MLIQKNIFFQNKLYIPQHHKCIMKTALISFSFTNLVISFIYILMRFNQISKKLKINILKSYFRFKHCPMFQKVNKLTLKKQNKKSYIITNCK